MMNRETIIKLLKSHCDALLTDDEMNFESLIKAVSFISPFATIADAVYCVNSVLEQYAQIQAGTLNHW